MPIPAPFPPCPHCVVSRCRDLAVRSSLVVAEWWLSQRVVAVFGDMMGDVMWCDGTHTHTRLNPYPCSGFTQMWVQAGVELPMGYSCHALRTAREEVQMGCTRYVPFFFSMFMYSLTNINPPSLSSSSPSFRTRETHPFGRVFHVLSYTTRNMPVWHVSCLMLVPPSLPLPLPLVCDTLLFHHLSPLSPFPLSSLSLFLSPFSPLPLSPFSLFPFLFK